MLPDELLMYQNPSRVPEGQYTGAPIQPLPIVREAGNVLAGLFGPAIEYGGRAARAVGRGVGYAMDEIQQAPGYAFGASPDPQALAAEQERIRRMRERRVVGEVAQPLAQAGANIFGGLMDGTGMAARGVMGAIPSVGRMPIDFRMPTDSPSDPAGQMGMDAVDAAPMFQSAAPPQARVEVVGGGQDSRAGVVGGGQNYKALRDQRMGQTESELSGIRMRDNLVRARRELAARNQPDATATMSAEAVQKLAIEDKQRKAAERLVMDAERAQYMERLLQPEQQVYLSEMRQQEQAKQFLQKRKMDMEDRQAKEFALTQQSERRVDASTVKKNNALAQAALLGQRRGGASQVRTGTHPSAANNPLVQRLQEDIFRKSGVAEDSSVPKDKREKAKRDVARAEAFLKRIEAPYQNLLITPDGTMTPVGALGGMPMAQGIPATPVAAGGPGSEYDDVMATFGIQF
jgi:hypothetical protein